MKAILSIKPQYVEEIKKGRKRYEYRKSVFKQSVEKVYIYASAPVSRIIGEFEPVDILAGGTMEIWEKTKKCSGITEEFYREYYKGRSMAYAIEIKNLRIYEFPLELPKGVHAPQSYCYCAQDLYK